MRLRKGAKITVLVSSEASPPFTVLATVTRGAKNGSTTSIHYKAVLLVMLSAATVHPELRLCDEGVLWLHGWSEEAKQALLAAAALAPEPAP
jgi:hypothetical protein